MHQNSVYKLISRGFVRGQYDGLLLHNVTPVLPSNEVDTAQPKVQPITLDVNEETLK
mgnify:FL=1